MISAFCNRWTDGALVVGAGVLSLALVAHVALSPRKEAAVAVVFRAGTSAARAIALSAEAGSRVLRTGPSSNIVVVVPDDDSFSGRAYARGALLVADASSIEGCEEPGAK